MNAIQWQFPKLKNIKADYKDTFTVETLSVINKIIKK